MAEKTKTYTVRGMKNAGLCEKMAELKRLEEETLAAAKADREELLEKVRGKGDERKPFGVMKFSDIEDDDWSADRYVPAAQAKALETALDRPTVAGMVSSAAKLLSERRVKIPGCTAGYTNLSRRTISLLEKSGIGRYAASAAKSDIACPSEGQVPGSNPGENPGNGKAE